MLGKDSTTDLQPQPWFGCLSLSLFSCFLLFLQQNPLPNSTPTSMLAYKIYVVKPLWLMWGRRCQASSLPWNPRTLRNPSSLLRNPFVNEGQLADSQALKGRAGELDSRGRTSRAALGCDSTDMVLLFTKTTLGDVVHYVTGDPRDPPEEYARWPLF